MASEYNETNELTIEDSSDFSGNYIEKFEGEQTKDHFPTKCLDWEKIGQKFYFHSKNCSLEVSVVRDEILKFRYGNDGYFEDDFSYGVSEDFPVKKVNISFKERPNYYAIHTEKIKCYVYKESLKLRILNLEGKIILEDEKGYHWQEENTHGGNVVISTKKTKSSESFYGLGDKTGKLNLRSTRKELWGTDCYGYGNDTDPVYKNIPFYLGQIDQQAYGIFLDNTFRTFFDFGLERKSVTSFWAQGGEMRYYFIYGPHPIDVVSRYTELTGKASLPPKWALGYHQSKWSYYPESVVRSLAKEFRDRKIPCDVIHLDIDYMDGFRCFTWDQNRFPDPAKMISDLKEQGFQTVVIIDPGIKIDKNYSVYLEGMEKDYFCKRGDGPLLKGSVWPGLCHFPDFTNPKARKWWAGLFKGLVEDGVAGVWNDMNEPAMFEQGTFPMDVRHDYDNHPCSHRKGHNVYGSLMAKSTNQGLKKYKKNKRAFTITRSAYAGVQKDACVWTGDNVASWEHLKIANIQCQRLSTSGVSFAGSDVGGFIGTPSAELYTRWVQMAVFHPFFRTHSSGDHGDKEPWISDEFHTAIIKRFIEFRYELLPYIYSAFWKYTTKGIPIIKSLNLIAPEDHEASYREEEFLFGDRLLVIPVSEENIEKRKLYLPDGTWYNYWTDECVAGNQEIEVATPIDQIPLFVKCGTILPKQPPMQYTDEFDFRELTLEIYFSNEEQEMEIYEDSGDGYDYQNGVYTIRRFTTLKTSTSYIINQFIEGEYDSCYEYFRFVFHQFPSTSVFLVDGENFTQRVESNNKVRSLTIPKKFKELLITITYD